MIGRLEVVGRARFEMTRHRRRLFYTLELGALEALLKRAQRHEFFAYAEYVGARSEVQKIKRDIVIAKKEAKNGNRKQSVPTRANGKHRKRAIERQPEADRSTREERGIWPNPS